MPARLAVLFTLLLAGPLLGFVLPTSLSDQIRKAETILRVVVISETPVTGQDHRTLVKCRVLTAFRGQFGDNFIEIPTHFPYDPQPHFPLGADCFVLLAAGGENSTATPVFWDAVHAVDRGKISQYRNGKKESLSVADFEKNLPALVRKWTAQSSKAKSK